jgi:hypothetical protein
MLRERAQKMLEYNKYGVPLNQIIDAGDLPFEHVPWGDDWFIPMGQVPARWILEGGPEQLIGPALPEGGEEIINNQLTVINEKDGSRRSRIWKRYIDTFEPMERQYAAAVRRLFLEQRKELIAKLESALAAAGLKTQNKTGTSDIIARVAFDLKTQNSKIKVIHRVFFNRAATLGAAQAAAEAGQPARQAAATASQQLNSRTVRSALQISSHKITKVNSTTAEAVAHTLKDGLDAGEGLPQLTDRIRAATCATRGRAQTIARTGVSGGG